MEILYQSEDIEMPQINEDETSAWICRVADSYGKHIGEIAYIFCSDKKILEVNNQYLHHDYYTDIITFDYCVGNVISGDLFISVDSVRENSMYFKTKFEDELDRVIVHGLLHLIGYDDHTDEQQELMRRKENYYLSIRNSY